MDLWVRSQNHSKVRKLLVNAKNISYLEIDTINANNHVIIFKDINMEENELKNYNCLLGVYATEERALEVLEEIQDILIDYAKISRVVYQMPKE